MWVVAIIGKKQWDSYGIVDLVIYNKLGQKELIYLVVLGKAYKGA